MRRSFRKCSRIVSIPLTIIAAGSLCAGTCAAATESAASIILQGAGAPPGATTYTLADLPNLSRASTSVEIYTAILLSVLNTIAATSDGVALISATTSHTTDVISALENELKAAPPTFSSLSVARQSPAMPQASLSAPMALQSPAIFQRSLSLGSRGADVTTLQNVLQEKAYLAVAPTGYFGALTQAALKKFQTAYGLNALGILGPKTRALLNIMRLLQEAEQPSLPVQSTSIAPIASTSTSVVAASASSSGVRVSSQTPFSEQQTVPPQSFPIPNWPGYGQGESGSSQSSNNSPAADTTPPNITSVITSSSPTSTVVVSWSTDENANSQVEYGTTNAYGSTSTLDPTKTTSHVVVLSGLSAKTTYHYRVDSTDASGNAAQSSDQTFTTAPRLMFAATRLMMMNQTWTPTVNQLVGTSRIIFGTPDYPVSNVRFVFANWLTNGSGEVTPGNSTTIVGASLETGTTWPAITFSGSPSYTLADGETVISDPIPVTLSADTMYYVRTESQVAGISNLRVGGYNNTVALGEGVIYSSTTDATKLQNGSSIVGNAPSGARLTYGPIAMVAEGWDGRPVFMLVGDSINAGSTAQSQDTRGNNSVWARGLDDLASIRIPYGVFAAPGGSLTSESPMSTHWAKRFAILNSIKNLSGGLPFTEIGDQLGINDIRNNTEAWPSPLQTNFNNWWADLAANFPGIPIYRTTMSPVTSDSNNAGFTTVADQVVAAQNQVTGQLGLSNAYILTKPSPLSGVIDTATLMADSIHQDKWATSTFVTTLANTIFINATQGTTTSAPPLDESLVFNPSLSNVSYTRGFTVYSATLATSTYTVNWTGLSPGTITFGATIKVAPSLDGLHPDGLAQQLGTPAIINAKNAGMFGTL